MSVQLSIFWTKVNHVIKVKLSSLRQKCDAYPQLKRLCQMNNKSDIQSMVSKDSNYFYSSL
jgi:hypothetical protein